MLNRKMVFTVTKSQSMKDKLSLRDSASSFHWLSSSIFSCSFVVRPASVTSPPISTIWCFQAYKPYIFCEDMILATCQCQHIFCCWVEPSLLLSSLLCFVTNYAVLAKSVLARFCVEKNWAKNWIGGEKMTNMRYRSLQPYRDFALRSGQGIFVFF